VKEGECSELPENPLDGTDSTYMVPESVYNNGLKFKSNDSPYEKKVCVLARQCDSGNSSDFLKIDLTVKMDPKCEAQTSNYEDKDVEIVIDYENTDDRYYL